MHHLNVLGQPDTARFITRALAGEPQGLTPLDLSRPANPVRPGAAARGSGRHEAAAETILIAASAREPSRRHWSFSRNSGAVSGAGAGVSEH